ncbi:MAG: alpha/beta hydrolase [Lachnospiraceae bacterium]|nr:alpha/beta hydrolase [Lachnospiraceae bacterium]
MSNLVVYIHGAGGNADEANHYKSLFPQHHVIGFDYKAETPWEAAIEFKEFFETVGRDYDSVILIANSIGAFFSMHALNHVGIEKAYFISPIVDMEGLISNMMQWAGVSETDLQKEGIIHTDFGQDLSWEYLIWVRANPISWTVPSSILHGGKDNMQSVETVSSFAKSIGADFTNWEDGEHWFHTAEQMAVLDRWICE